MVDSPVVTVRGEAYREVAPELARFTVTATARDRDCETTLTRHTAVGDAVSRAREYAEALGARVTALIELADVGVEPPMLARMAYAEAGGGLPELELDPQTQTVQAAVRARFATTAPVLD